MGSLRHCQFMAGLCKDCVSTRCSLARASRPTLAPGVFTPLLAHLLGYGLRMSSAGTVVKLGAAMGPPLPFKICIVCSCCCCGCLQGALALLRGLALRRGALPHRKPGRVACPACGVHHDGQRKAALARLLHLDELLGRPLQHAARSASQTPMPRTACWRMHPKEKVYPGHVAGGDACDVCGNASTSGQLIGRSTRPWRGRDHTRARRAARTGLDTVTPALHTGELVSTCNTACCAHQRDPQP